MQFKALEVRYNCHSIENSFFLLAFPLAFGFFTLSLAIFSHRKVWCSRFVFYFIISIGQAIKKLPPRENFCVWCCIVLVLGFLVFSFSFHFRLFFFLAFGLLFLHSFIFVWFDTFAYSTFIKIAKLCFLK